ncbi:uncharacterized protein V6R79_002595 [Siganus canaliculatus]
MVNQPDIAVVDKQEAILSDSNFRKKGQEKLEKFQGLKDELEKMWKEKICGALWAETPTLGQRLLQVPRITSEISLQKSTVLGTAKILSRTPRDPRSLVGDPSLKEG